MLGDDNIAIFSDRPNIVKLRVEIAAFHNM